MQLPPVGQDSKICGKCGEQGHVKRQCMASVVCDFCKTRSHATLACRTYANFVKEHPLTSSRKNTLEFHNAYIKFHNELDVNMEVARRVEMELRKWQRENGPKGKPPLPQSRKQSTIHSQEYLSQEQVHSQDIRVQIGEPVHTELHQPQHRKYASQNYQPTIKANNHFITEDGRNYERGPPEQLGNDPVVFDPQYYQPMIKANNRFIAENLRNQEREIPQQYDYGGASGLQALNETVINCNIEGKYLTGRSQQEFNLTKEPRKHSENVINHISINTNETQQRAAGHSQQVQRNLDAQE